MPNEKFIKDKRMGIKGYTKVEIPRENVVMFEKNAESLKEFVHKIKKNKFPGMHIDFLEENAQEIVAEISDMTDHDANKRSEERNWIEIAHWRREIEKRGLNKC
jgi:uncharacterized protein YaaN involved in tellurite resistance